MRINEDYIEDLEDVDIQDQELEVADDAPYDFEISMTVIFDSVSTQYKENSTRLLTNYLEQNPLITRFSEVIYKNKIGYFNFSICHAFKTPLQIVRFVCGLFKCICDINKGVRYEIQIKDPTTRVQNNTIFLNASPVNCLFVGVILGNAPKRIWLSVWQVCKKMLPEKDFTIEQIADAIPNYNIERLFDDFMVNYKKKQFDEFKEYNDEIQDGWAPDADKIETQIDRENAGISYIQLMAYNLCEGEIRIYTSHLNSILKDINPSARFCKHMTFVKRNTRNINNDFLFAYLGCGYIDYGRNVDEATMVVLCAKFNESINVNDFIDMIKK